MKKNKLIILAALMLSFSTSTMAQEAELNAALQAIKSKAGNTAELVKVAQKKNKKNADALVAIGRAFLEKNDTAQARNFANLADVAGKHKSAAAFMLLGDIEAQANEGGKAASAYKQAIYFDPKNPDPYYKYALVYRKISPRGAEEMLRQLAQERPDIEVNEMIGRIYSLSLKYDDAIKAWKHVPVGKMERGNVIEYALANYFLGHHADGLQVATEGLKKFPRAGQLNRLAMMFNYELKNYQDAAKYGEALFNASDSTKFSNIDYFYHGMTLDALKNYDQAIQEYNKALNDTASSSLIKKENIMRKLAGAYEAKKDYLHAIDSYRQYLGMAEKPTANDYAGLGSLFMQQGADAPDAEKAEAFKNADQAYADLAQKFESAAEYATFMRARVNGQLDPGQKQGLAKPFYEQLIESIAPKAEKDNSDIARLKESYLYLISYYFVAKNDKATAKTYAQKLMEVDPTNEVAKQVLGVK